MIRLVMPGHPGIFGYRVVVDPMLRDGYAIVHPSRTIVFALSTAQRMIRHERRRLARACGRRMAASVPRPSFAAALGAYIARKDPTR